jgi:hypothetical protein
MADQATGPVELVSFGMGLSLGAQLAFAGQLLSMLIANKSISEEHAKELLTKVADTITTSLDQPASDLEALAKKPLLEHAEALRKLAADLIPSGA